MTPAEHYVEAERLLHLATGDFPSMPIAPDIAALAQVHATLATVSPADLRQAGGIEFFSQHSECTCPTLPAVPIAKLSIDPDCPIHGEKG